MSGQGGHILADGKDCLVSRHASLLVAVHSRYRWLPGRTRARLNERLRAREMLVERELACTGDELGLIIAIRIVISSILLQLLFQRPPTPRQSNFVVAVFIESLAVAASRFLLATLDFPCFAVPTAVSTPSPNLPPCDRCTRH